MVTDYRDYFLSVATSHQALQHADVYGKRCFEMLDMDTAFGQLRDGVRPQAFIFRLIRPRRRFDKEEGGSFRVLEGGFLIAHHADVREDGDHAETSALDASLQVCDEIVALMVADSRNGHPLFQFSADKADQLGFRADPAKVADGTYYGYLCTFEVAHPFEDLSTCNPSIWSHGGLTPY